jgi:glycosyltransferase involved in cell wall biosynthesis
MTAEPRFSVVIPAYNEELYLGRCLQSLALQDFPGPIEVIVVDNNSTDRTAGVAVAFGATVVVEPRPGVCWARQAGTAAASGEIVVSADADTVYSPGWLSAIAGTFDARAELVAVAGPCVFADAPWWGRSYPILLFGAVHLWYRLTGRVFYVSATNIAFRRSAFSGYDTRLAQGGDEVDLLRRLQASGPVAFDRGNPSLTSSRRLTQGLAYNIVVTFLWYYLLGYWINRLMHRQVLGMAPAFGRTALPAERRPWRRTAVVTAAVLASLLVIGWVEFRVDRT